MPNLKGFRVFGGQHANATAVAQLLAHAGQVSPIDGEAFDDVMVFGIGGGIANGLGDCPSVLRYGAGAGLALVGGYGAVDYAGAWQNTVLQRLGAVAVQQEASSDSAAQKKMAAELDAGRAVLVQCARMLPYYGTDPTAGLCGGSYAVVVYGFDATSEEVMLADTAKKGFRVNVEALGKARGTVCTHKRRQFSISAVKPVNKASLAAACLAGIRDGVAAQKKPRIKTLSLAALPLLANAAEHPTAKTGWTRNYAARLAWPLFEIWSSIEVMSAGGGLARGFYAQFLERAAGVTGRPALGEAAAAYRLAEKQWRTVAAATAPRGFPEFAAAQAQLLEANKVMKRGDGERSATLFNSALQAKAALGRAWPLETAATQSLLHELAERIRTAHAAECSALDVLALAAK